MPHNNEIIIARFENGFIGLEIRNRRFGRRGSVVKAFKRDESGRKGQAEKLGTIKPFMPILSVNDKDLRDVSYEKCLNYLKKASRPMCVKFGSRICVDDLPRVRASDLISKSIPERQYKEHDRKESTFNRYVMSQVQRPIVSIEQNKRASSADYVSLLESRKRLYRLQQQKLGTKDLCMRVCCVCKEVTFFDSDRMRFLFRRCPSCFLEFNEVVPLQISQKFDFGQPAQNAAPVHTFHNLHEGMTLTILAASFGHRFNPKRSVDVTKTLQDIVNASGKRCINVEKNSNMFQTLFLYRDPAPGEKKTLHIRCCFGGAYRKWEVYAGALENSVLTSRVSIHIPSTPWLRILEQSYYGHPKDPSKRYEVSEILQYIVDSRGRGCFLEINSDVNLKELVGDPDVGSDKILNVKYELEGWMGHITVNAIAGYLFDRIEINAPIVTPQLIIFEAVWGVLTEKAEETKRSLGSSMRLLKEMFQTCVDITGAVQRQVDVYGYGRYLVIDTTDDVIQMFNLKQYSNKEMDQRYVLFIRYSSRGMNGHIIIEESQKSGHLTERLCILAPKYKSGINHAQLKESRKGNFVAPFIKLSSAVYGEIGNCCREYNVLPGIQSMLDEYNGERLVIAGINEDEPDYLFNYFDDPVSTRIIQACRRIYHVLTLKVFYPTEPSAPWKLAENIL